MVNCISKYGQYKAFASLQYYSMGDASVGARPLSPLSVVEHPKNEAEHVARAVLRAKLGLPGSCAKTCQTRWCVSHGCVPPKHDFFKPPSNQVYQTKYWRPLREQARCNKSIGK